MKKLYISLPILFLLFSCNDDSQLGDDLIQEKDNTLVEQPIQGQKLKKMEDKSGIHHYFYNSAGFIDSIYHTDREFSSFATSKFHYNNHNKVTSIVEIDGEGTIETPINQVERKYIFSYNSKNQIIKEEIFNGGNILIKTNDFNYTNDGYLQSDNLYFNNGNLITERDPYPYEDGFTSYTYTYNNKLNPFYIIYPDAYKKIRLINKNDVVSKLITDEINGNFKVDYELEYNTYDFKSYQLEKYNGVNFSTTYTYY